MRRIYLDANGSCPSLPKAQEKLLEIAGLFGNPSSSHDHGRKLRGIIDEARQIIAHNLKAKEKEIIFTSGASEANRLFVDALLEQSQKDFKKPKVLLSPFEHPSLLKPILRAHERDLILLTIFAIIDGQLQIDPHQIKDADVIIACQAHNETGLINDLDQIVKNARENTLIMSDISQAWAREPLVSKRVDVLTFSAQKMGGFPGIGGMAIRGVGKTLPAPWPGGGQEKGYRPGTESALLIASFGEAARHLDQQRAKHQELKSLRDYFEDNLRRRFRVNIIGQDRTRLSNTSAVCFVEENPDALRISCDLAGLSVGFGAACSGLAPEGSFALKRLGLDLAVEKSTIRFSLPPDCTKADLDETITRIDEKIISHKSRV
jgi:cysteine desulfurase